jgi:hypothetical protein
MSGLLYGTIDNSRAQHHEFSRKQSHRRLLILFISVIQMYVALIAVCRKGRGVQFVVVLLDIVAHLSLCG